MAHRGNPHTVVESMTLSGCSHRDLQERPMIGQFIVFLSNENHVLDRRRIYIYLHRRILTARNNATRMMMVHMLTHAGSVCILRSLEDNTLSSLRRDRRWS